MLAGVYTCFAGNAVRRVAVLQHCSHQQPSGQSEVSLLLYASPNSGIRSDVMLVWLPTGPAAAGEVWAVWRSCPRPQTSSSSSSPASLGAQQLQLHSPLDGREGSERAAAAVLRSINSSSGLLSTAVLATGRASLADSEEARAAVLAALPLQGLLQQQSGGAGDGQQLWPQEHLVSLAVWHTTNACACTSHGARSCM